MHESSVRARLRIDLTALSHNLANVKARAPNAGIMAVIKANAYGHGMIQAAEALSGADEFAVSSLQDVALLREAGIEHPITTLSAQFDEQEFAALDPAVKLTIFDHSQLRVLEKARPVTSRALWLKIDTGMGRLGFLAEEIEAVMQQLRRFSWLQEIGLMTHLANADDPHCPRNSQQFEDLQQFVERYNFDQISVLNSAGVCAFPQLAHETVRPGLMLYGASPLQGVTAAQLQLVPSMTFSAPLIAVRDMPVASPIGYGSTEVLDAPARVGIVACGYGDGYPRHARSGTPVIINNCCASLLGRVSMDMIAVNLGDIECQIGDRAILWGAENPIEKVAECADTIAYELMCGVTERVHREFHNG